MKIARTAWRQMKEKRRNDKSGGSKQSGVTSTASFLVLPAYAGAVAARLARPRTAVTSIVGYHPAARASSLPLTARAARRTARIARHIKYYQLKRAARCHQQR